MNWKAKIVAYVVLSGLTLFLAVKFYQAYNLAMETPPMPDVLEELPPPETAAQNQPSRTGAMMKFGAGLFLSAIGLALLASHDISKFVAGRAEAFIVSDDGEGMKNPEYEEAEQLWANGQPLEAIRLMRDHLKKNPRHQYVALRIAEIYEKDLNNPLAAALEYEEVLKHRLAPERWGWAAIHLVNLYSGKLGKPDQAEALLHRLVNEFGQTAAARKARERLGIPEPEDSLPHDAPEAKTDVSSNNSSNPPPDNPPSNLPPGFRPKGS